MTKFLCTDGYSDELEVEAETTGKAAQAYVDGGDWGERDSTTWVHVSVVLADDPDDTRHIRIAIDPAEPDCTEQEHDWRSPYSVLGGLEENPGVYGHGGGVIYTEVCAHCGAYRVTDTWAQDPENGEQGLTSISYREPDEASEEWVGSLTPADGEESEEA